MSEITAETVTQSSRPAGSDHAESRAVCEHYWAYHCYDGLSVRLCMFCHEPDWESVRADAATAWRDGYGQGRDDEAHNLPLRTEP